MTTGTPQGARRPLRGSFCGGPVARPQAGPRGHRARGFTLVEIMAVLVLLGILTAVLLPRFGTLQEDAALRALDAAVAEMNTRETMAWGGLRIDNAVPGSDAAMNAAVLARVDTALGDNYTWTSGPGSSGGTLKFQTVSAALARSAATLTEPAAWSR